MASFYRDEQEQDVREDLTLSEKMDRHREEITDSISCVQVREIVHKLYRKAVEGDVEAARLLLAYAAGQPEKRIWLESEYEMPDEDPTEDWKLGRREEEED